ILVEQFPEVPVTRADAEEHQTLLKKILTTGVLRDGTPLDENRRQLMERMTTEVALDGLPEEIPPWVYEISCELFGHICPAFFTAGSMTEEKLPRYSAVTPDESTSTDIED
ncbi:hypothetical protein ACFL3B_02505, partial [Gemmatimonadota bacterium]